jgi:hypothetical protein
VVGCTIGSREEVPGERKPVIRNGNNDDDDDDTFGAINRFIRANVVLPPKSLYL